MDFFNEFKANVSAGNYYCFFFIIALFVLFFLLKERRIRFVIPSILISIFIFNPIVYKYWNKLGLYAYWRVMWIIPIIPVCAAIPATIAERINNKRIKTAVGILLVLVFVPIGSFIYKSDNGKFELPCDNYSKLPDSSVDVATRLLEEDENPKVVAVPNVSVYIRQFTGEIDTLYGRDIYGYIGGTNLHARYINDNIYSENGNMKYVADVMLNEGYDYLVTPFFSDERENSLQEAGFEYIDSVAGYEIYKVHGTPTVLKVRNSLGQVLRETTLDALGNPIDGDRGYATIEYNYDKDGNIIYEFHLDKNGEPFSDIYGVAGYERTFDRFGRVLTEKNIDVNKTAIINNSSGYAGFKREYIDDKNIIKNLYTDENGNPILIPAGYSAVEKTYDANNNVLKESYYGIDKLPTACLIGYASVEREYDQNGKVVLEHYYDTNGDDWEMPAGYCGIRQEYYEDGSLCSREYLGANNQPISRKDGYSKAMWVKNSETGVTNVVFYDINGDQVSYDGLNLVKDGFTEWSEWMTPNKNTVNSCFSIGMINLGNKKAGDIYTCQIEVEFKDVTSVEGKKFKFWTQGMVDEDWDVSNVWNPKLLSIDSPPKNGIYTFSSTCFIDSTVVNASFFEMGFRCDNWNTGSFRVRNVKIEKGDSPTEWSQGI